MRQENWSVRKLRKLLDNKIAAVENVMREGLESASTDYCRFFEWKAAYLYKGELLRGHYRLLRNKVSRTDDVEDLKRYCGDIAMYHRERLTGGTPAGYPDTQGKGKPEGAKTIAFPFPDEYGNKEK